MGKATVYEVVTDRIIKMLEAGVVPWRKEWSNRTGGGSAWPTNLVSHKEYRGTNAFVLGVLGAMHAAPHWLTFKQAQQLGGTVRKGEHGTPVIYFKPPPRKAEAVAQDDRRGLLIRFYTVFNLDQCDGIEAPGKDAPPALEWDRIGACERVVAGYSGPAFPTVRHGGNEASYSPQADVVRMPHREQFAAPEHYYATLFHELTHSTGHESRLARATLKDANVMGDHAYSEEELVAEMGSAFLCARTGIAPVTEGQSAAYVAHWLKKLRDDRGVLVRSASAAQKAVDLVAGALAEPELEAEGVAA